MGFPWKDIGKSGLVGGGSGALTGAAAGALFGRMVLFSGVASGFGVPAVLGLAAVGLVVGAVGGAVGRVASQKD